MSWKLTSFTVSSLLASAFFGLKYFAIHYIVYYPFHTSFTNNTSSLILLDLLLLFQLFWWSVLFWTLCDNTNDLELTWTIFWWWNAFSNPQISSILDIMIVVSIQQTIEIIVHFSFSSLSVIGLFGWVFVIIVLYTFADDEKRRTAEIFSSSFSLSLRNCNTSL